jgi:hypothetical protein
MAAHWLCPHPTAPHPGVRVISDAGSYALAAKKLLTQVRQLATHVQGVIMKQPPVINLLLHSCAARVYVCVCVLQTSVGWPWKKAITVYASATAKPFLGVQFEGADKKITGEWRSLSFEEVAEDGRVEDSGQADEVLISTRQPHLICRSQGPWWLSGQHQPPPLIRPWHSQQRCVSHSPSGETQCLRSLSESSIPNATAGLVGEEVKAL